MRNLMVSATTTIVRQRLIVAFLILASVWVVPANAVLRITNSPVIRTYNYKTANIKYGLNEAKTEADKLHVAVYEMAKELDAVPNPGFDKYHLNAASTFKFYIDEAAYYIASVDLQPKRKPNEVCHPLDQVSDLGEAPIFKCKEGQLFTKKEFLLFFNPTFENVGVYELNIKYPHEFYVSDLTALAVNNKDRNELLVSAEYFPIDKKTANSDDTYNHMTMLLRLKAVDGKIQVEQDDTCLKNPNKISNIATARKLLKQCETNKQKPVNSKAAQKNHTLN